MNISPSITGALAKSLFTLKQNSPLLLTVVGVAGLVTAGVLGARATLKLEDTVDFNELEIDKAKNPIVGAAEPQEVTKAYIRSAVRIGKLYWVPLTLATGSVVMILAGHKILNQRNAALVVAYQGLQTAFNNYREAIIERYGAEIDKEVRYGLSKETVTIDGKKVEVLTADREKTSDYIFSFGPENENYVGNVEHNLFYLKQQEHYANERLRANKHLMLSEVLDSLGIPRTEASFVTGWIYDPRRQHGGSGDDEIDFGILDLQRDQGYILLDFNVDGQISHKVANL